MANQTDEHGRRLGSLFNAGRKLPVGEKTLFIQREAAHDPAMAAQLANLLWVSLPTDSALSNTDIDPFDLKRGTEFGGCEILLEVGAGGMGAVYLARDLANEGRLVALKVMKPTLPGEADTRRFAKETAALSRLVHPNIAQFYYKGFQESNGAARPYFVMEYVEGLTLDRYLQQAKPTRRQLLMLLRKICLAVHHGHLKGVFHRDLKPSNILITADGEPKIIDFGIAMVAMDLDGTRQNQRHERTGTILYMAPETARGDHGFLDARTDVYSLGIITFEMFGRRKPSVVLPSGDLIDLDQKLDKDHILDNIASCERERLGGADRDLQLIVTRSLRLRMEDRYGDASELAEDLRRLVSLEPISARPSSRIYTAKMFALRNRFAVLSAAAVFLAILASAIFFAVNERRVKALLVQTSENLRVIQRKNAEAHFRSANLAEQRGNWAMAFDEFCQAEQGGYPDQLALAVGELRSVGRLNHRSADVDALMSRVHGKMPKIANSPQFQVVEGFIDWTSKPDESLRTIQLALAHADQLAPADRAFAEALITDDIKLAAAKLQETVKTDPFNHDAWVLLGFCDISLGNAQKCEQDAGVLQRLYPDEQVAALLESLGAAFQGRGAEAHAYLENCPDISMDVKSALDELMDFISQNRSTDDLASASLLTKSRLIASVVPLVGRMASQTTAFPMPLTFGSVTNPATRKNLTKILADPNEFLALAAKFPNGSGSYVAGELALHRNDWKAAQACLNDAMTTPGFFDCRRSAAFLLLFADAKEFAEHHQTTGSDQTALIKKDLDRLISLGGVFPDKNQNEMFAFTTGVDYGSYRRVRTLAHLCLARTPDDPRVTYYLAIADANLGDHDNALSLFKRAITKGLSGELKADAERQITQFTNSVVKRPATMPS